MPYTKKTKGLCGADLGRMKKGKKTKTSMTEEQLIECVKSPTKRAVKKKKK